MMQIRLSLFAILVLGTSVQTLADATIPLLPQHYDEDHQREDNGIVMFHGSVYASPCIVAPRSRLQIVELGDISARRFHQAGDRSQPVLIQIAFKDCLKGAAQARDTIAANTTGHDQHLYTTQEQAIQLSFIGESDVNNTQLLRTTGDATGAGIRLLDAQAKALDINQTQPLYIVKPGDSQLTFMASLESTGRSVSAGDFSGLLRLKMEYM